MAILQNWELCPATHIAQYCALCYVLCLFIITTASDIIILCCVDIGLSESILVIIANFSVCSTQYTYSIAACSFLFFFFDLILYYLNILCVCVNEMNVGLILSCKIVRLDHRNSRIYIYLCHFQSVISYLGDKNYSMHTERTWNRRCCCAPARFAHCWLTGKRNGHLSCAEVASSSCVYDVCLPDSFCRSACAVQCACDICNANFRTQSDECVLCVWLSSTVAACAKCCAAPSWFWRRNVHMLKLKSTNDVTELRSAVAAAVVVGVWKKVCQCQWGATSYISCELDFAFPGMPYYWHFVHTTFSIAIATCCSTWFGTFCDNAKGLRLLPYPVAPNRS